MIPIIRWPGHYLKSIVGVSAIFLTVAGPLRGQITVQDGKVGIAEENPLSDLQITAKPENGKVSLTFKDGNTTGVLDYFDGEADNSRSQFNLNFFPSRSDGNAVLGLFRSTNTTGSIVGLQLFKGDGSGSVNTFLSANNTSYLNVLEGNVGIGTNNPKNKLQIRNTTDGTDVWAGLRFEPARNTVERAHYDYQTIYGFRRKGLWIGGSSNGNIYLKSNIMLRDDGIFFGMSNTTSNPEENIKFSVTNEGNIGVGTDIPMSKFQIVDGTANLHVHKSTRGSSFELSTVDITAGLNGSMRLGSIDAASNNFSGAVIHAYANTAPSNKGQIILDAGSDASSDIILKTGTAARLTVKKDGKIGIGTNNPSVALEVSGNTNLRGGNLTIGKDVTTGDAAIKLGRERTDVGHAYIDLTNDPNNYATYGARLIRYNSGVTSLVHRGTGAMYLHAVEDAPIIFHINGLPRVAVNTSGLLPSLDNAYLLGSNSFRWKEIWSVNGNIRSSDRRLKKEITDLNYGLKEIMQLNPVSYRWKKDDEKIHLGFIAQEVAPIVSEVVVDDDKNDESNYLAMNYSELIPVLVKAVQEQQLLIEQLNRDNTALKSEVSSLRSEIQSHPENQNRK